MATQLKNNIISFSQHAEIQRLLAIYHEEIATILDHTGQRLEAGRLAELRIDPWTQPESETNLFWRIFHVFFPEEKVHTTAHVYIDHPQFPQELRHAHNRLLKAHVADVKTGKLFGLFRSADARREAVTEATENADALFVSRYFVLLILCVQLVTFACSTQEYADPVSVITAVERIVQRAVQEGLLEDHTLGGRSEGRRTSDIQKFCRFLIAEDGYLHMLNQLKSAVHSLYLLELPKRLLAADIESLRETNVQLRKLLALYLDVHRWQQTPAIKRPFYHRVTRVNLHPDYLDETFTRLIAEQTPLALIQAIRAQEPELAEHVKYGYRTQRRTQKLLEMTQSMYAFISQLPWATLIQGAFHLDQYAKQLHQLWDQVRECNKVSKDNPLLHPDRLNLTTHVISHWHQPILSHTQTYIVTEKGVALSHIDRHDYLSQPSIQELMQQSLQSQLSNLLQLSRQYSAIFNGHVLQRLGMLLSTQKPLQLLPTQDNQHPYLPAQLFSVMQQFLPLQPEKHPFCVLLGQAQNIQTVNTYWDLHTHYYAESLSQAALTIPARAFTYFFEQILLDETWGGISVKPLQCRSTMKPSPFELVAARYLATHPSAYPDQSWLSRIHTRLDAVRQQPVMWEQAQEAMQICEQRLHACFMTALEEHVAHCPLPHMRDDYRQLLQYQAESYQTVYVEFFKKISTPLRLMQQVYLWSLPIWLAEAQVSPQLQARHPLWENYQALYTTRKEQDLLDYVIQEVSEDMGTLRQLCEGADIYFYEASIERALVREYARTHGSLLPHFTQPVALLQGERWNEQLPTAVRIIHQLQNTPLTQDGRQDTLLHRFLLSAGNQIEGITEEQWTQYRLLGRLSDGAVTNAVGQTAFQVLKPLLEAQLDEERLADLAEWEQAYPQQDAQVYRAQLRTWQARLVTQEKTYTHILELQKGIEDYVNTAPRMPRGAARTQEALQYLIELTLWRAERLAGLDRLPHALQTILNTAQFGPLGVGESDLHSPVRKLLSAWEKTSPDGGHMRGHLTDPDRPTRESQMTYWDRLVQSETEALRAKDSYVAQLAQEIKAREAETQARQAETQARQAETQARQALEARLEQERMAHEQERMAHEQERMAHEQERAAYEARIAALLQERGAAPAEQSMPQTPGLGQAGFFAVRQGAQEPAPSRLTCLIS